MKNLALVLIAACGGGRQAETSQPTTTTPVARRQTEWWCVSFNNNMNGLCIAGRPGCDAMLGELRRTATDPDEKLDECTRQANPICFDKTVGGKTELVCHPSSATCRSHADHVTSKGDTVSECRSLDPDAQSTEPASNWFCVAHTPANVGSCSRSIEQCEDARNFLRSKLPGETIECAAQAAAMCLELEDDNGKRSLCHPSATICFATLENAKKQKLKTAGGCRSVE